MEYIKVRWLRPTPQPSAWLYHELDDKRYEARKVELYDDGHCSYANETEEVGDAGLSPLTIPTLAELANDPHFEPYEITKDEFERVWEAARSGQYYVGFKLQLEDE